MRKLAYLDLSNNTRANTVRIQTTTSGQVVQTRSVGEGFVGTLPEAWGSTVLATLVELDLSNNALGGTLPPGEILFSSVLALDSDATTGAVRFVVVATCRLTYCSAGIAVCDTIYCLLNPLRKFEIL